MRNPPPTTGRKVVGVFINAFGLVAAVAGFYFAALAIGSIAHIVTMARSRTTAGLAAPAIAVVGMFDIMFVFVFGFVAVICLSIGAWILEPLDRWRSWRRRRAQATPPASSDH
jgi:hypothetical protein